VGDQVTPANRQYLDDVDSHMFVAGGAHAHIFDSPHKKYVLQSATLFRQQQFALRSSDPLKNTLTRLFPAPTGRYLGSGVCRKVSETMDCTLAGRVG